MRALVCHAYGPIDNLKIEDIPQPVPKAGEVLASTRAATPAMATPVVMRFRMRLIS